MDRRRALATVVSLTIGATGIAAAVGATTRVFNVAEASPGVGRVSPVDAPTSPPVVDPPVVTRVTVNPSRSRPRANGAAIASSSSTMSRCTG